MKTLVIGDPRKKITLDSMYFDEMRKALNTAIEKMTGIMESKGATEGDIGLKILFSLKNDVVKDDNSPTGEREALQPNIKYKIGLNIKTNYKIDGGVADSASHEIIRDDTGDYFIVSRQEASGQLTMFNNYNDDPDSEEDVEPQEDFSEEMEDPFSDDESEDA